MFGDRRRATGLGGTLATGRGGLAAPKKAAPKKGIAAPKKAAGRVTPVTVPQRPPAPPVETLPIHYNMDGNFHDGDDDYYITMRRGTTPQFRFGFSVEGTPYCCGLKEIGRFDLENRGPFSDDEKHDAIRRLISRLIDNTHHEADDDECITLIFTAIDNNACEMLEAALSGTDHFTLVKTFRNSNSNNVNRLYVSNN